MFRNLTGALLVGLALAGMVTAAQGATVTLLERDLFASGDGLLTYDPSTRVEWLDLTETYGLSAVEVANAYSSLGFVVATVSDVFHLFQSTSSYAGSSSTYFTFDDAESASQLLMLGPTGGDGTIRSDIGGWALNESSSAYDIMYGLFSGLGPNGVASQGNIQHLILASDGTGGATVGVYAYRIAPHPHPSRLTPVRHGPYRYGINRVASASLYHRV